MELSTLLRPPMAAAPGRLDLYAVKPPQSAWQKAANVVGHIVQAFNSRRERRALSVLATTNPFTIQRAQRADRRAVASAVQFLQKRNPAAVKNWYESGYPFLDGSQSFLPSIIQDARYDQNTITRREMLRKMRYWSQNSDVYKSGLDVSRQYTIGTHTPVVTSLATSEYPDEKGHTWSHRAVVVFNEMCEQAGFDGESLFQQLTVAHDCKKTDGDILFVEASRPAPAPGRPHLKIWRPCFKMVEGHRIETPPNRWQEEGKTIVDGVQFAAIDVTMPDGKTRKMMQRTGYHIKDSWATANGQPDAYTFIPIEYAALIFTPHRVDQIRGLSDFYAVEPTLALLEDLLKMEMRAQEVQSNLSVFITNGAGQLVDDKAQATLGALNIKVGLNPEGQAIVTADDIQKAKEIYKKIWGGETFVGRTGDSLGFLAPTRPAEATLNLWDYLINSFCMGARLPRILVFPKFTKGQGTEVRAELDRANTGFRAEFNLNWKPLLQRIWNYFIGWAIKNDPRCADAPANWQSIEVSPPRSVLVDLGYDSSAMLAELAAGITNLHFIAQKLGTTRDKLIDLSVSDIVMLKKACNKASGKPDEQITVEPAEVRQSLSVVLANLAAVKQAETAAAAQQDKEMELAA